MNIGHVFFLKIFDTSLLAFRVFYREFEKKKYHGKFWVFQLPPQDGAVVGFLTNGRSNSGVLLFLQNLIASVFIPRSLIWDHTAAATIKSLWVS